MALFGVVPVKAPDLHDRPAALVEIAAVRRDARRPPVLFPFARQHVDRSVQAASRRRRSTAPRPARSASRRPRVRGPARAAATGSAPADGKCRFHQIGAAGDARLGPHPPAQVGDGGFDPARRQQPFQAQAQASRGEVGGHQAQAPAFALEVGGVLELVEAARDDERGDAVVAGRLGRADAALMDDGVHQRERGRRRGRRGWPGPARAGRAGKGRSVGRAEQIGVPVGRAPVPARRPPRTRRGG